MLSGVPTTPPGFSGLFHKVSYLVSKKVYRKPFYSFTHFEKENLAVHSKTHFLKKVEMD